MSLWRRHHRAAVVNPATKQFFYSPHFTFIVPGGLTEIKMSLTRDVAEAAAVKQNSDSNTATTCLLLHTPNDDL